MLKLVYMIINVDIWISTTVWTIVKFSQSANRAVKLKEQSFRRQRLLEIEKHIDFLSFDRHEIIKIQALYMLVDSKKK